MVNMKMEFIYGDGKYYLGEYKNDIPNGKGIKYYKNGNILYEGDFINGKFEGNGKLFFENSFYCIGKYKNGLRNGKGKIYYANGNIRFEGDYINDKTKGIGKFIWKDGAFYIDNLKMSYHMERVNYMIQMEIFDLKVIIFMVKEKELENLFMKIVHIIQANGKKI